MGSDILVSIIITGKNVGKSIKYLMDGLARQKTSFNFEVIYVDAGSTDNTICLLYTSPSPRDRG